MDENIYFPANTFGKSAEHSDPIINWYTKFLSAMGEPSLWHASKVSDLHACRFLWLRTFHQPVVVRMEIEESGAGILIAKVADGRGGYEPGNLIFSETSRLSREDVDQFLKRLMELEFWEKPTIDQSGGFGIDGAQWVLECVENGRHHVLNRWSPREGDFRDTALMLAKLANITVEEVY